MQQHLLFGNLATAYALNYIARDMTRMYDEFVDQRARGDFSQLAEIHATSAGLKALVRTCV